MLTCNNVAILFSLRTHSVLEEDDKRKEITVIKPFKEMWITKILTCVHEGIVRKFICINFTFAFLSPFDSFGGRWIIQNVKYQNRNHIFFVCYIEHLEVWLNICWDNLRLSAMRHDDDYDDQQWNIFQKMKSGFYSFLSIFVFKVALNI